MSIKAGLFLEAHFRNEYVIVSQPSGSRTGLEYQFYIKGMTNSLEEWIQQVKFHSLKEFWLIKKLHSLVSFKVLIYFDIHKYQSQILANGKHHLLTYLTRVSVLWSSSLCFTLKWPLSCEPFPSHHFALFWRFRRYRLPMARLQTDAHTIID